MSTTSLSKTLVRTAALALAAVCVATSANAGHGHGHGHGYRSYSYSPYSQFSGYSYHKPYVYGHSHYKPAYVYEAYKPVCHHYGWAVDSHGYKVWTCID